uniref:Uncharacterized protein n=1 Tax=viral metagenome TaxID=1070528 RepID=A0A6M3MFH8_9ZZZZ
MNNKKINITEKEIDRNECDGQVELRVILRAEIKQILRQCTYKMKEAEKKKDQRMWEFWAAKREGVAWVRDTLKQY